MWRHFFPSDGAAQIVLKDQATFHRLAECRIIDPDGALASSLGVALGKICVRHQSSGVPGAAPRQGKACSRAYGDGAAVDLEWTLQCLQHAVGDCLGVGLMAQAQQRGKFIPSKASDKLPGP